LKLDEEFIDFGEVERDSSYTLLVPFTNTTRGYLVVAAGSHVPWLRVETEYAGCYAGEQGQIQVTLDTNNMPEGMHTRDALALAWEDQQRIVPARLVVTWPPGGQMMPQSLEFDIVADGAARPMQHLSLRNTGGSDWVGRVQSDAPWLIVQGSTFRIPSQRELNLPVGVNPQRLELAEPTHGRIALISNGGSQVTTASARLVKPWYTGRGRLRRWLAFAAPTLLSVVGLSVGMAYLATALLHLKDSPSGQLVNAAIGLAAWILGLLVAGVFVPPINELENYHHGGDLTLDVPVSRFVRSRALITIGVGIVAGLIVGVNYGSGMPEAGLGRVASILAGMLLGGLAGLLARVGSNDYLLGTRIAPGLNWFVRHPALLALSRTALTSLSLALLGVMLGGEGELIYPVTAALAGLILTSDGYPYLPTRLRQWLSWIRPAALVIATSYAVMLILFQLAGRPVLAMDGINQRVIIFTGLLLMARLGGAVLGIASVDEVGYNWQRELRQSSLLGLILLVAAAAVYWLASGLIEALTGSGAREVSQAVALVLVTLLALGLTGRSQQLRQWIQRGQSGAGRWLQQYEISQQAQGLVEQQASQLQRFSGDILVSTSHLITLASMVAIAVLCAPSVARLFGAVLWLAVLAA
ncbi:MAG: hypothetical protein KDE45_06645, partial [Caldilineaceae bacterium]|nr:hypothetical protein [Caldilineaceae bacterium]